MIPRKNYNGLVNFGEDVGGEKIEWQNLHYGDIVKVNLDPVKGHEEENYRPVVIINKDEYPLPGEINIILPITTHGNNPGNGFINQRCCSCGTNAQRHIKRLCRYADAIYLFIRLIPSYTGGIFCPDSSQRSTVMGLQLITNKEAEPQGDGSRYQTIT